MLSDSCLVTHGGRALSTKNELQTQVRQDLGYRELLQGAKRERVLTRSPQTDRRASDAFRKYGPNGSGIGIRGGGKEVLNPKRHWEGIRSAGASNTRNFPWKGTQHK